ncbi:hypothetical protein D3C77_478360 [compost metagenome]
MVNQDNKGVKIVGARSLADYANALEQVLEAGTPQAGALPEMAGLLQREQHLFSKEIEVMYDLQPHEVNDFLEKSLSSSDYTLSKIMGETFVVSNLST